MGLTVRLILILTVPAVFVVGAHGFLRIRQEHAQLVEEEQRMMALTAQAIRIAVENALRDRQISDVRRLIAEMAEQQPLIDRIRLLDRELQPTLVSSALSVGEDVAEGVFRRVMATGTPEGFYRRQGRRSFLYHVVPLRDGRGAVRGTLEIVHQAAGIDDRRRAAANDVWLRLGILVVVMVVLSAGALQYQVLRPLARLLDGIQRLGRGDPGAPLQVARRDELGRLAEAFNEMAAQLEAAQARLVTETERTLELEQQLRQAETLAVAGKLASAVAHEVGTPLNIISGRAEFLQTSPHLDDAGRKDLQVIGEQIERISKIIRSMLDTVRPQKLEVQAVALTEVLDRILPLLRHPARRRGVRLSASIPDDLPALWADPGQIQQVLINLVLNALDATPAGGQVEVTAAAETFDDRPGVATSVGDTGPGIPADVVPRVFEPFFTTKPAGGGTGLGLAICRDIVKAHRGDLRVQSEVGRGTTFTAWIPAAGTAS